MEGWIMASLNAIIDLSHHIENVDFQQAKDGGIIGVIYKATQGTGFTDPTYAARKQLATDVGLLWGGFHFGIAGDGVAQADHFLDVVQPGPQDLLVLDFEANPSGDSMSLDDARAFVTRIQEVSGRFPGFYSGDYIKQLLGESADPLLSQCWFWLAQYSSQPVVPPNWPIWTMWQYTDGTNGPQPRSAPGVGPCDRNQFNGSEANLRKLWGVDET
jgi:lysozyme